MNGEKTKRGSVRERIEKTIAKLTPPLVKAIGSELQPFLDGMRTTGASSRNFKLFKEAYLYFLKKCERQTGILDTIMQVRGVPILDIEDEVYMLFVYLGMIESLGNNIVDIISMLLVANGRDFHIECQHTTPRIKHAISIQDLEKERVSLTTKLNFLKENDISRLTSIVDSRLRNDIAHLKLDVKEGEIYIRGKPAKDMVSKSLLELMLGISVTSTLLEELAKERGISL